jgi:hypothetical protein
VKLLLTFLLGTFFLSVAAARRGWRMRVWPLLVVSVVVAAGYLFQRNI